MSSFAYRPPITARSGVAIVGLGLVAACTQPLDFDLRGNVGGFSTTYAAQSATGRLPAPDSRGVISYPTYQVAVAREGDKIADVAQRVGLPASELAKYNSIDPNRDLRAGEIIALPRRVADPSGQPVDIAAVAGAAIDSAPSSAAPAVQTSTLTPVKPAQTADGREPVQHKVARGETAYTIARLYDVPIRSLAEWNSLGPDFAVREGQYLLIPVGVSDAAPASAAAASAAVSEPGQGSATPTPPSATQPLPDEQVAAASDPGPEPTVPSVAAPTSASQTGVLILPVQGSIVSDYQPGRKNGIEIAGAAGAPVKAAATGKVVGVTQNTNQVPIVILEHPNGLLTIYVGLDEIAVTKGDQVSRGQAIGSLPNTNGATLHFEVRDGIDNVQDPNDYL